MLALSILPYHFSEVNLGKKVDLHPSLEEIGRRYNLEAIYVFGSRAEEIAGRVRGQSVLPRYPTSDVDIGVKPASGCRLSVHEQVHLAIELEDLLDVSRVDLVVLPEAGPFLAVEVIRGELLYCVDPDALAEYELYVLRRAGDLLPYACARYQALLDGGEA